MTRGKCVCVLRQLYAPKTRFNGITHILFLVGSTQCQNIITIILLTLYMNKVFYYNLQNKTKKIIFSSIYTSARV